MSEQIITLNGHQYLQIIDDASGAQIGLIGRDPAPTQAITISKFAYRSLFTMAEKIAIDNYDTNASLTEEQKQQLAVLHYDFQVADNISLSDPATIAGTQFLESCGLIAPGRAAQILANQPAPA